MIRKVLNFIEHYGLAGKIIIVGFSGGADSSCLLDIMQRIADEKRIKLIAAHYNHNWRGIYSKKEMENCKKYCTKLGIEIYTETCNENIRKTETEARNLRYDFFKRVIDKYNADALFTAHNYDDNAETVLYRIIKGTGIDGLCGIRPVREKFYRPFLNITRKEIEEYCRIHNLNPNRDSSNNDIKYNRNFIRYKIIPILEQINPYAKKSLNNLIQTAAADKNIIKEYILSKKIYYQDKIKTAEYKKLSKDMKFRIIYDFIQKTGAEYSREKIENIYNFLENLNKPSMCSLFKNHFLYANTEFIEIISKYNKIDTVLDINEAGIYKIGKAVFKIEPCTQKEAFIDKNTVYADLSQYQNLTLRTRRSGDIISPLGAGGTVKLKKYLINKKIPRHKRDKLVFLCCGNEILWAAGIGLSDKIKITNRPTHKLSINYNEDIP